MKLALQFISIIAIGFLGHQFLPFWVIALAAALATAIFHKGNGLSNFGIGFLAALLLWGVSAWYIDAANLSLLSGKISGLFQLQGWHLIVVTSLLGGFLGGMGALTGYLGMKLFQPARNT